MKGRILITSHKFSNGEYVGLFLAHYGSNIEYVTGYVDKLNSGEPIRLPNIFYNDFDAAVRNFKHLSV